ncbi:hypothetical protein [Sorangium sp. So ce385]|uniref:hypothetical protein n=1 Tax=Sorangium sp. So ce385 TaxID=3133308 RepID=UPI003F5B27E7
MTKPELPPLRLITAGPPRLAALLEVYLPKGWELSPVLSLSGAASVWADMVVLRLVGNAAGAVDKLHSIFDHLRPHTLILHKRPTCDLEAEDVLDLLADGCHYMLRNRLLDPVELCRMVACDGIRRDFVEQVERHGGTFRSSGGGLWCGDVGGFSLHGVVTREAWQRSPAELPLYALSRAYVTAPEKLSPLEPVEKAALGVHRQVGPLQESQGVTVLKDYELARRCYEEVMEKMIEQLSREELLDMLSPVQPLDGGSHEQRRPTLTPEEFRRSLPPKVREMLEKKLGR